MEKKSEAICLSCGKILTECDGCPQTEPELKDLRYAIWTIAQRLENWHWRI